MCGGVVHHVFSSSPHPPFLGKPPVGCKDSLGPRKLGAQYEPGSPREQTGSGPHVLLEGLHRQHPHAERTFWRPTLCTREGLRMGGVLFEQQGPAAFPWRSLAVPGAAASFPRVSKVASDPALPLSPRPAQAQPSASLPPREGAEPAGGPQGEEPSAPAEEPRRSPALPRSPAGGGKADGAARAAADEEEEVVKDRTQQSKAQPPQPSTGPASRAARGSSTSIPFIDCSDVDSESDLLREQASQSQTNDNYEGDLTSGVYLLSREERRTEARPRASPPSVKSSRPPSREFLDDDSADLTFDMSGSPRLPRHSSLIDELFRGSDGRSSPATPVSPASRQSSPNLTWDRTGSQGYVSENGHDPSRERTGEDALPSQGPLSESSSPVLQRPYLRDLPSRYNKSETDPLILSQVATTPQALDGLDGREKGGRASLAASGGRMLANGAPFVGPTSKTPAVRSACAGGLAGPRAPLHVTEGSTSSGTESSDSDSEMGTPLRQPLTFGNPAVLGSPCMRRSPKQGGGLRVSEEAEEAE